MQTNNWSEILWGNRAKVIYLLGAALLLFSIMLGNRELWTQEHRWADIVSTMFDRHDFLHPYLNGNPYYDKPLLSYWFIVIFSFFTGHFSLWAMRLPSVLAGVLAVWSIYSLGTSLKDKRLGMLAGWMLLTTFYFIFWARTSSSDMLNVAGSLFAVSWYFSKKNNTTFFDYAVFFLILAVTALCKGLVGAVVACLAIFPDVITKNQWKKHLNLKVIFALIPAVLIYSIPFLLSSSIGNEHYSENGLYLVYRENVLRYFQPFDHKGPLYTYFLFLPIYLLPWTLFFIPALLTLKKQWSSLTPQSKWMIWAFVALFVFFTLSGSRRNYYVLPMVPFAILITADWLLNRQRFNEKSVSLFLMGAFSLTLINFLFLQPLYYAGGGLSAFAKQVHQKASKINNWEAWNVVMLDPESKMRFYLQLSPQVKNHDIAGNLRNKQTADSLIASWPVLKSLPKNTIFISRQAYKDILQNILKDYDEVDAELGLGERLLIKKSNMPVAFIPKKTSL